MRLGSTRKAIQDALAWGYLQKQQAGIVEYLTYLCKIQKSQVTHDCTTDFLEVAYICAAINSLGGHLSLWIEFCYGPWSLSQKDDYEQSLKYQLTCMLAFTLFNARGPVSKKHQRHLTLSEIAINDKRMEIWQERQTPIEIYAKLMDSSEQNFNRDFGQKKRNCLKTLDNWDKEGVGHVSRMVQSLKGKSDFRPSEIINHLQNEGFNLQSSQS